MGDELREACGVFACLSAGTWPSKLDVREVIVTGLMGLQHRGQECAGLVVGNGDNCYDLQQHKGMGLVGHVFKDIPSNLQGNLGIGHTRYSTTGKSSLINCQPFVVETIHGRIALAHNGELVNASRLKEKILKHGTALSSGSDTELLTQILSHSPNESEMEGPNWYSRIRNLMSMTSISYSFVLMYRDSIYAVRDPFGNRPLCIGSLQILGSSSDCKDETEGWVISSESGAFASVGAKLIRSILPGEIVELTKDGYKSLGVVGRPQNKLPAFCLFEYVYFARPDSIFEEQLVHAVREKCGKRLAIEAPVKDADIVSTVPESATPAAIGYALQMGLPYSEVLCKNRYVGRTFIQPSTRLRQLGVAMKFGVLTSNVVGKNIVLIDDSIVRGNTMAPIVKLLKSAGANQVHIRIASPPIKHSCHMGINIPTTEELIANQFSLEGIEQAIGADSVVYMTLEGLIETVKGESQGHEGGYCTACLTGNYPVSLDW